MLRLEGLVRDGTVKGHEVFMFTDNSVFESSYYRGHSTSEKLSDITFRLHRAVRGGRFQVASDPCGRDPDETLGG